MFSIAVEEVFLLSSRKGITLVGKTSGVIKIGDYLVEADDRTKCFKVIGIEIIHYTNEVKNSTHNPAIMIEFGNAEPMKLKGKILESL